MSGSRPWAEIRADFPDCPTDAHHATLDLIEDWLDHPDEEPPGGWSDFYQEVTGLLVELNGAGATLNSLKTEWSSSLHPRSVFAATMGEFAVAKGVVADAKPLAERASKILKARFAAETRARQEPHPEGRRWQPAPASVQALRKIDLALERYRCGNISGMDALDLLMDICDTVDAFYGPGEPDPPQPDDAEGLPS